MQHKHAPLLSLLLVVGIHVGVLAAVVMSPSTPKPIDTPPPTIQGVLVMAPEPVPEPIVQEVQPPPEPKPEPKPKPKPKPIPKAAPSERAVKAPEPEPIPPVETPIESKPAEPAPVLPPHTEASELNNPAPPYPAISRRLGEKGTVLLEILINANGMVTDVKIKKTSGYKRLDNAAIGAIKRWRFIPAMQAGKAIEYWYEIAFDFGIRPTKNN